MGIVSSFSVVALNSVLVYPVLGTGSSISECLASLNLKAEHSVQLSFVYFSNSKSLVISSNLAFFSDL